MVCTPAMPRLWKNTDETQRIFEKYDVDVARRRMTF